jgi:hypothetical protein
MTALSTRKTCNQCTFWHLVNPPAVALLSPNAELSRTRGIPTFLYIKCVYVLWSHLGADIPSSRPGSESLFRMKEC